MAADVYSTPITYLNFSGMSLPIRDGSGLNQNLTGEYVAPGETVEVTKKSGDWIYIKDRGWVSTRSSQRTLMKLTSSIPSYTSDATYNAEDDARVAQANVNKSIDAMASVATLAQDILKTAQTASTLEMDKYLKVAEGLTALAPYASSKQYVNPTVDRSENTDEETNKREVDQKPVDFEHENATKAAIGELRRIGENDFIIQSDLAKEKRFGMFDRVGILDATAKTISTKEYVFFTKPDLHIFDNETDKHGYALNPQLMNTPLFVDGFRRYKDVLAQLQSSIYLPNYHYNSPFMNLLSNNIKSSIDLPAISADDTATAANIYGTAITYRDTSEKSDDAFEFNVEFEDTKYLEVYMLFKFYDEYERKKHDGIVSPIENYIKYRILHDQFSVYKFIVGEDGESLIYWAKFYGVYPKGVPRDVMNEVSDNKIRFTVPFKCQFMDDMDPQILTDFSLLTNPNGTFKAVHSMHTVDPETGMGNLKFGTIPFISVDNINTDKATPYERATLYKLRWIEDSRNVSEIRYQDEDADPKYTGIGR